MHILWLCNVKLPIIAEIQGTISSPYGGWLDQLSRDLLQQKHRLTVLYPAQKEERGAQNNLIFEGFVNNSEQKVFSEILTREKPDVIHIWGTEFAHAYTMTETANSLGQIDKVVISIQGLVSIYADHYILKLPQRVVHGYTVRDALRRKNVYHGMREFRARGETEIAALSNVKHIIGRTNWDKACAKQINPEATYHHCGEILRRSFYQAKWSLEDCERNSIFVSQASYPIKGFHIMLEAMGEIVKYYPQSRVYVAGQDPTYSGAPFKLRLKRSYYGKYLISLIKKYGLQNNVIFTGPLSEEQMCERYLKSHVFVSPSTIENSPNSLGEAMLLGMPCVSSYVGGVPDMLEDKKEGFLYQADAPYMLAYYVMKIFCDNMLSKEFGQNARIRAQATHSRKNIFDSLLKIYTTIQSTEKMEDYHE